jgi:hypothetical protein
MTYFLEKIAQHLYAEFGDELNKHCLVFPNRRAGLYFLKYLAEVAGKPIWSPWIKTINELFQSLSLRHLAESEILVFELYKVYTDLNPKAGTIDDFFFWGEMIVNDFDDVDKYLADQEKLFINIQDIKDIETKFGSLTEDQIRIIRQFWVNFNPDSMTDQKNSFREIWSVLLPLYNKFKSSLVRSGYGYEGMIYREIAEKCINNESLEIQWHNIHFIGFNALNACEIELMMYLRNRGTAKFYWDYDEFYTSENIHHSAGFFLRDNIKKFGNDMPSDWNNRSEFFRNNGNSNVRIIDCSSDNAQVKLASELINGFYNPDKEKPHHTAIVLADENLILPMLTSIPDKVEDVNITMGYPLKFSPVYSLVSDLMELQSTSRSASNGDVLFNKDSVIKILSNSFFSGQEKNSDSGILIESGLADHWIPASYFADKNLNFNIFRKASSSGQLSVYLKEILEGLYILSEKNEDTNNSVNGLSIKNEFIYRVITTINRLDAFLRKGNPEISVVTYKRLLDKILRGLAIPFTGEPLNGIQIMGLLETRSLDFTNLIILSVNEGILPRASAAGSFIPLSLREAFGLPTIRHQDSIYSYYFYRLLQRAKNIVLLYNSSAEGLRTGEMSRLLLQLEFSQKPPSKSAHRFEIKASSQVPSEIMRTRKHSDIIASTYLGDSGKTLSPSAVNTWLTCTMKFYYSYVCGIKEPKTTTSEVDSGMFGELLHLCMEKVYSPFKGNILDKLFIDTLLKNDKLINTIIIESVNEKLYNKRNTELKGNDLIISNILKSYLKLILSFDSRLAPLTICEMEYWISAKRGFIHNGKSNNIRVGGFIDRLDMVREKLRITDYKTGKIEMQIPSIESLFDTSRNDRNDSWFQLLMYCSIFKSENPDKHIRPAIYPVRSMYDEGFLDTLSIKSFNGEPLILDDFDNVKLMFDSGLEMVIADIFSNEKSFIMTDNIRKCSLCPYAGLCQRK